VTDKHPHMVWLWRATKHRIAQCRLWQQQGLKNTDSEEYRTGYTMACYYLAAFNPSPRPNPAQPCAPMVTPALPCPVSSSSSRCVFRGWCHVLSVPPHLGLPAR